MMKLLMLGLACYRLSLMVSKEAGPFWMFKRFRWLVKAKAPKKAHMDEGVKCPFCTSMWFGILLALTSYFWWEYPLYQLVILALDLSAVAVICNQLFTKGEL